ncbi:hypothetical protein K2173_026162 [Erythroxylum novogranatense]|uniref:Sialate O-acetylesterase domain-containing protein n=1 Tax=Erythroxylum novogranatense TaxID=1862640 RepID=A0AAV8TAB4_9ROSI|nr:hypothetical protein K2173_026162 [Erythroxylum novogranatense]
MLSFLWLSVLLIQARQLVTAQQPSINIFILAGQSNMAGRGGLFNDTKSDRLTWDGTVPPQCQPNPSILRLTVSLAWVTAHEPLHVDIDYNKTNGIGPGMPFSNAILTQVPNFGVVGLVPCAVGGTNIQKWAKGGFLYQQLVRRTQAALTAGGVLRGMLWYQGEADTITKEDSDAYKGRLEKFFTDVRTDLQYPSLPIFQVALASGQGPYLETVREAQLEMNLPHVHCVDAKGLPLEPDRLHLTTPAQVKLGRMLADSFLESLPDSSIHVRSNYAETASNFIPTSFFLGLLTTFLLTV